MEKLNAVVKSVDVIVHYTIIQMKAAKPVCYRAALSCGAVNYMDQFRLLHRVVLNFESVIVCHVTIQNRNSLQ